MCGVECARTWGGIMRDGGGERGKAAKGAGTITWRKGLVRFHEQRRCVLINVYPLGALTELPTILVDIFM